MRSNDLDKLEAENKRLALALNELEEVCENQKAIRTNKLQYIVDRASNKLKDEAVYIRNMVNRIPKEQK